MNRLRTVALIVSAVVFITLSAQGSADGIAAGSRYGIGIDLRPAYVVPSNGYVEGDNVAGHPIDKSMSAYVKFLFTLDPKSRLGQMYPQAYQGIGVGVTKFMDAYDIGNPISVYIFQGAPIVRFNRRLSLDYEWNFGASFGWKPYSENQNPTNGAVGSSVNAYINLAVMARLRMSRSWSLFAGLDFTHYSNGNTDYPNSGINMAGLRLGLTYMFNSDNLSTTMSGYDIDPGFVYDVAVYGSAHKNGFVHEESRYLIPGRFGVLGMNFGSTYRFNKYFGAGATVDLQYDEGSGLSGYYEPDSSPEDPKFYRPPFSRQFGVGLSARAELTMGFFAINVGLGHNVVYKGRDLDGFYQTFTLKTFVTPRIFLNVGYKLLRFKDPGNLMLGVGYRFGGL
ncbi:MAG: acyloxyacyl hydrolase [Muribaculum sp.]|nr:acyloxyacyl hydrolase [Muribaculum sp.]